MLNLFISSAFAEDVAGKPQMQNGFMSFIPFILIFAVFYFLMIRPQKKKLDEEKKMLMALGKGDEVYTKSGIIGTISGLTDDIVTLEVGDGVKMKMLRGQVGGLSKSIFKKES